ncbi:MAG: hypothetical protein A2X23_09780 [Chloroflexi bacterium GWC2_73_18]|nr:MAG: hypothetical protein A2X23_09780 [Chloroflexi bacterium GWC2_73_18]
MAAARRAPCTIADVAARAGVSPATVSRILSGALRARPQTRERVLGAVADLHYRPSGVARSLKLRTTRTLGLIVTDIENPFYPEVVRAIEDAALASGLALMLCNGAEDPEREAAYLELLAGRRVDGIIVAASRVTARHGRWLAHAPIPIVLVNCEAEGSGIPAILSDNRAGGRLAAEHLLALGHRAIGHLTAPVSNAAAELRLAGVREALSAIGLAPGALAVAEGDGHVAGGERAMAELLARAPGTTGVVCYNDLTAIGAMRALREHGLHVPRDVSVVGFDDLDLAAYVDPPLTTVAQQKARMGRWAVERLLRRIAGEPGLGGEVVHLDVSLQVRGSTAPRRAGGAS